ncbi:MAG: serine hydroxymethyltransferase, partial [Bacteroidales bacterium]|nr:serine hydroxymethyltransferase [Bacteroidales bacterium]
GKEVQIALEKADITANKNMVPFDSRSAFQTSGIRLGTPAITTRGIKEAEIVRIVDFIDTVIKNINNDDVIAKVKGEVNEMMSKFPLDK